jgi:Ligated ion channel L-glutamate- and glycine-binding site.
MRKHSDMRFHGNAQYEGYAVDILEEISQILGFTYEFIFNYEYGSLDPQTNRWTGMLHELQVGVCIIIITILKLFPKIWADYYREVSSCLYSPTFAFPVFLPNFPLLFLYPF